MKSAGADGFDTFMRSCFRGASGWEDAFPEQRRVGVPPEQVNPFYSWATTVDAQLAHVSALRCTAGLSSYL